LKRKGKKLTAKRRRSTRKKNPRHKAKEPPAVVHEPKIFPSKAKESTFLTEGERGVCECALRTNSVKAVCAEKKFSRSRYYEVIGNIVRKWGMSRNTGTWLNDVYNRAKKEKNMLARQLTEVKRVELVEPTISPPGRIETTITAGPMGEE